MLVKIANKWVAANTVTDLGWVSNVVNGEKTYSLFEKIVKASKAMKE